MTLRLLALLACFFLLGARGAEARVDSISFDVTRFPPTFDENAFAYGFALFSLTTIAALATALLMQFVFERRVKRIILAEAGTDDMIYEDDCGPGTACALYRFQIGSLLWMALLGCLPDVLVLLAWGEASDETMWLLFQFDRICDGLCGIPFGAFALSYLISGSIVQHRLALDTGDVPLRPRWVQIKEKVKIVALALVIAIGVTSYKAGLA